MFEYVPKSEYQPFKLEVDEILKSIQRDLRENGILTFQFNLIGSAKRKLITRVENGNQGFDLDYNIVIQRIFNNRYKNAKLLKQKIRRLWLKYLKNLCLRHMALRVLTENALLSLMNCVKNSLRQKRIHSCLWNWLPMLKPLLLL